VNTPIIYIKDSIIAACAAIMLFSSCRETVVCDPIDKEVTPMQVVHEMAVVKSENGQVIMRMTAPTMERYSFYKDSMLQSYEYYPDGFNVKAYTKDGELETSVVSEQAKHTTTYGHESWSAFGDVVIINYLRQQTMTTDTIYWNQEAKTIYTDCYVHMTSPQGELQGYGMESDEMARNSIILHPFDSYTVMQDSTEIVVDSVNFLGPLVQRF
jgi:Protein of unknown function (DUF1239).